MKRFMLLTSLVALGSLAAGATTNAPFTLEQRQGVCWLRRPEGERFFSLGVCVVNQGATATNLCATNPAYAAFEHYADAGLWADTALQRLKSWHFTTVGGWSDYAALRRCREPAVAFIPVLALGMTCGAPWRDMWDPKLIARMHQVARDQILPWRGDSRLLGYYTDNEMGWWNAALLRLTFEQPPISGQRQRLLQLLRQTYHNAWPELLGDFEPEDAGSFEDLERGGILYLRPGSQGIRVYRRFLELMAERYYSLVREIIRTYDARGLILGDRYQSFYYPEVVRASGSALDVSSSNLNAAWNDGTFPRFYLDTLHALSGKPVIVSEFYLAAQDNSSGDRNDSSTFPVVATQRERAAGFCRTVESLLQLPYVVGADWFQYYDEPGAGRSDGENYNFGLVDIHDQPYTALTTAARQLNFAVREHRSATAHWDASLGVPPAPPDPLGHFTIRRALADWDRERGFVKPFSELPVADLYVCWDKQAIYLGLYAQDIAEDSYYRDKVLPEVDRAQWTVSMAQGARPIHARLGPGGPPSCDELDARLVNLSGIYMNTRNIAALALPAKLFGKSAFQRGDTLELDSTFFSHARADRVQWKGRFKLTDQRR